MSLSDHVVRVIHLKFVFSLQVNRYVLLVRKSFLTHRTFESVLDPALEPHVPVEIIVPVIRFPAFLAFEGLPACRLLLVLVIAQPSRLICGRVSVRGRRCWE